MSTPASQKLLSRLNRVGLILLLVVAAIFSIKAFKEPDLWWIMLTGEWILQNGHPPFQDPFSFTQAGTEWINVKWGFEVLSYLLFQMGGPAAITLLQCAVSAAIMLLAWKSYKVLAEPETNIGLFSSMGLVALMALEFRFNSRPEMVSHFMVALYIFWHLRHFKSPDRRIYWLVLFQVIWTNFHEAYGTGMVISMAFLVGAWLQYWLVAGSHKPLRLTYAVLASIAAIAINPRGPYMIAHPFNIFGQLSDNQFTSELFSFQHPSYWGHQAYIALALALAALGLLAFTWWSHRKQGFLGSLSMLFSRYSAGLAALLLLFLYLSLTARRNIPFLPIVCLPLAVIAVQQLLKKAIGLSPKLRLAGAPIPIAAAVVIYGWVASNRYYEQLNNKETFGLGLDVNKNPVGLASALKQEGIAGKKVYSDYLISAYLMWECRPDFKSFIDLRDLDVFPADFFNLFNQTVVLPEVFDQVDENYGFDYAAVFRPQFSVLHQHLYNSSKYQLVYVDQVAALYKKADVSKSEEQQQVAFNYLPEYQQSGWASSLNNIIWPFYEREDYHAYNLYLPSAQYYQSVGEAEMAYTELRKALSQKEQPEQAMVAMANFFLSNPSFSKERPAAEQASILYRNALKHDEKLSAALKGLGVLAFQGRGYKKAIQYFEECVAENPLDGDCHEYLAEAINQRIATTGKSDEDILAKRLDHLRRAQLLRPGDFNLTLNLGVSLCQAGLCSEAIEHLKACKGYPNYNDQQQQLLKQCLKQCR